MRLKDVFDREAPIEGGLLPIWFIVSFTVVLLPDQKSIHPIVGLLVPFGVLIGLHWLFRFGKWIEFRASTKKRVS